MKGIVMFILIALGMVMGFGGLIQSEAFSTKTIHGANIWLTVMWIGWAMCAVGFIALALKSGKRP